MVIAFWYGMVNGESLIAPFVAAGSVLAAGVIITLLIRRAKMQKLRRSGIFEIDKMDGRQFEHYLGLLFKSQGYSVEVTSASGDYGADLVLAKNGRKIVVQAKRYSKNVGLQAVQEVQAAKAHYGATEAWVVTNRDYTEQAYTLAKSNAVQLINRQRLIDMILQMNPEAVPHPTQSATETAKTELLCERCGKQMVIRKGPRGEFYGCTGFPKCRNTKEMTSQKNE